MLHPNLPVIEKPLCEILRTDFASSEKTYRIMT